jgi:hypothetical protein
MKRIVLRLVVMFEEAVVHVDRLVIAVWRALENLMRRREIRESYVLRASASSEVPVFQSICPFSSTLQLPRSLNPNLKILAVNCYIVVYPTFTI